MLRNYLAAQYIQRTALQTSARVVIFPEDLLAWNTATEAFWSPTFDTLRARHSSMIVGATMFIPGRVGKYRNVAVLRGATSTVFDQRIPIPITMWKPFGDTGVPIHIFGPGTVANVDGQKAAVIICYEQLLVWPIVRSIAERPTVLVGIANDYWAVGTYFPAIQQANLHAWGRLFNLPVITAVNQ
jgi:predicted amidohydrolase